MAFPTGKGMSSPSWKVLAGELAPASKLLRPCKDGEVESACVGELVSPPRTAVRDQISPILGKGRNEGWH